MPSTVAQHTVSRGITSRPERSWWDMLARSTHKRAATAHMPEASHIPTRGTIATSPEMAPTVTVDEKCCLRPKPKRWSPSRRPSQLSLLFVGHDRIMSTSAPPAL
ncbi:uncharacterized protein F4807DRAFT_462813 [Annulohypoxylon truncatum]|uniref:uncharacterized protein n=1 Tax=Annulohypoxylon truncatum TaxID=327061 RepID=UPI0020074F52|nr:uncharacterized protein F4807DRAFT_462813 [Annulohypoxylon truncatum]KAI1207362.1 hypothetical protein F4807DRAFT_462813 [Annulohypoxylon truncatum]